MKKYLQPIFLEGLQGTLSLSLSLPLSLFLIFLGFPLLMSHFNILHCPFQECRVRDRYIDSEHQMPGCNILFLLMQGPSHNI